MQRRRPPSKTEPTTMLPRSTR